MDSLDWITHLSRGKFGGAKNVKNEDQGWTYEHARWDYLRQKARITNTQGRDRRQGQRGWGGAEQKEDRR